MTNTNQIVSTDAIIAYIRLCSSYRAPKKVKKYDEHKRLNFVSTKWNSLDTKSYFCWYSSILRQKVIFMTIYRIFVDTALFYREINRFWISQKCTIKMSQRFPTKYMRKIDNIALFCTVKYWEVSIIWRYIHLNFTSNYEQKNVSIFCKYPWTSWLVK